jgi:surfeit locus 1 family protein
LSALLTRWRQARLVWPTIAALAGLVVLIGLGSWQMSRKVWKEGLLARISARVEAEPVALGDALRRWRETGDVEYLHVRVAGRFRHDAERHVFTVDDKLGPGYLVYTPLESRDARLVLVNRGFVPALLKDARMRPTGQVAGEVTLTGLVRLPVGRGWFLPASDPERNMFYWPDYPVMLQSVRHGGMDKLEAAPFFIDADARAANPGGFPQGGTTRLALPNRHVEYALTWYGIALTLVGVFAAFAIGRLRALDLPQGADKHG